MLVGVTVSSATFIEPTSWRSMAGRDPLENPEPLIRRVYAYVAYRIGDGPDAEDVTSATFERALRYRDTFDPRRGQPVAWLLGIAGRCLSEYYSNRPMPVSDVPEIAAAGRAGRAIRLRGSTSVAP